MTLLGKLKILDTGTGEKQSDKVLLTMKSEDLCLENVVLQLFQNRKQDLKNCRSNETQPTIDSLKDAFISALPKVWKQNTCLYSYGAVI